jgi:hypothetical protein
VFDLNRLLKAIDKYTAEKGYEKAEKRRQEIVKPEGKRFTMELRPIKVKTDVYSLMIKIRITITDLKKIAVKDKKKKKTMHSGNIVMLFDAWLLTEWEGRWEKKPYYYFFLILVDKFIKKLHSDKYVGELIDDTHYIHENVKAHLNLHRY